MWSNVSAVLTVGETYNRYYGKMMCDERTNRMHMRFVRMKYNIMQQILIGFKEIMPFARFQFYFYNPFQLKPVAQAVRRCNRHNTVNLCWAAHFSTLENKINWNCAFALSISVIKIKCLPQSLLITQAHCTICYKVMYTQTSQIINLCKVSVYLPLSSK